MDPKLPPNQTDDPNAYLLPSNKLKAALQPLQQGPGSNINPPSNVSKPPDTPDDPNTAAALIRSKIESLYAAEPNAQNELVVTEATASHRSKHQQFMHDLHNSGKPLAEIQTAWHDYYAALPEQDKHAVWQDYYTSNAELAHERRAAHTPTQSQNFSQPRVFPAIQQTMQPQATRATDRRSISDIKNQLADRVSVRSMMQAKSHFQSLLFGLATGSVVLIILLFGFFNERFLAPFITPSRNVSATPIIVDTNSDSVNSEPKIIIPKINVEIPVVYDEPSVEEGAIQQALERGVVHYATTPKPGELGNSVIFGHSSNNILNKGKYKFAFVLLNKLEPGDTFYLNYENTRYAYRVFSKKVVPPTDLSVLQPIKGKAATATLITCDPPGTSLNRLIVNAEQISPEPSANVASSATKSADAKPAALPSNAPSLWSRLTSWLTS